jgi:hypothetical protein
LKTAIAIVAILLLAACAATGTQPADTSGAQVKGDSSGNVVNAAGEQVLGAKY